MKFLYRRRTEDEVKEKRIVPDEETDFALDGVHADQEHGVSVNTEPNNLKVKAGEIYVISRLPAGLNIGQQGDDPSHYLIVPEELIAKQKFINLCAQIRTVDYVTFSSTLQALPEELGGNKEAIIEWLQENLG